ncbi:terminase large subunit domain-containing protein [Vibrio cholerae]|uniref:terminase large subunit domain-containing protein n=1 Tax=Vibrio cholerae TaxID=666 RepID=UPI000E0A96F9|nr:terminase family protein [Vibrio cholerae]
MIDEDLLKQLKVKLKRISDNNMSNLEFFQYMKNFSKEQLGDDVYDFYDHAELLEHGLLDTEKKLREVFPMTQVNMDRHDTGSLTYKAQRDDYRYQKKPDYKNIEWNMKYEPHHAIEWLKCLDPLYFMREYCYLKHVTHGLVKFIPRKYQEQQLRLMQFERNTIFAMSRQVGKTQTASGFAAHYVSYNSYKSIGIIADTLPKAENMLRMIMLTIANLPCWIQPEIVSMSKDRVEFANGSSIQAFSSKEDSMRGFQCSCVFIDEAAFIGSTSGSSSFKDIFSLTIDPTLSSGSDTKCIVFSTPNGSPEINYFAEMFDKAGDYFEGGQETKNGFIRYKVLWNENPENLFYNKSDKAKNRAIRKMKSVLNDPKIFDGGEWFKSSRLAKNGNSLSTFEREYCVSFNIAQDTLINGDVLMQLETMEPTIVPVQYRCEGVNYSHSIRMFRNALPNERFILSADVARGVEFDNSAFIVYSHDKGDVVATFYNKSISLACYSHLIGHVANFFNEAMVIVELNGDGRTILHRLEKEIQYKHLFRTDLNERDNKNGYKGKVGIETNQNKKRGCKSLKAAIECGKFVFYDEILLNELKSFIEVKTDVYQSVGHNDDLVMSCVLLYIAREQGTFMEAMEAYQKDRSEEEEDHWITPVIYDNGQPFRYRDSYSMGRSARADHDTVMSSFNNMQSDFQFNQSHFFQQQQHVHNSMSGWDSWR